MGHWLGTGTVADKDKTLLPFNEARLCTCSLKLKGEKEYKVWRKSLHGLPTCLQPR